MDAKNCANATTGCACMHQRCCSLPPCHGSHLIWGFPTFVPPPSCGCTAQGYGMPYPFGAQFGYYPMGGRTNTPNHAMPRVVQKHGMWPMDHTMGHSGHCQHSHHCCYNVTGNRGSSADGEEKMKEATTRSSTRSNSAERKKLVADLKAAIQQNKKPMTSDFSMQVDAHDVDQEEKPFLEIPEVENGEDAEDDYAEDAEDDYDEDDYDEDAEDEDSDDCFEDEDCSTDEEEEDIEYDDDDDEVIEHDVEASTSKSCSSEEVNISVPTTSQSNKNSGKDEPQKKEISVRRPTTFSFATMADVLCEALLNSDVPSTSSHDTIFLDMLEEFKNEYARIKSL